MTEAKIDESFVLSHLDEITTVFIRLTNGEVPVAWAVEPGTLSACRWEADSFALVLRGSYREQPTERLVIPASAIAVLRLRDEVAEPGRLW